MRSPLRLLFSLLSGLLFLIGTVTAQNVRLSNDTGGGYIPAIKFLNPSSTYTDPTINECRQARGRQNEPAIAVNPRNTSVLIGSANDYCGVYNATDAGGHPIPTGPIWLGYYRSENGGASFQSSLVPGYPDDTSPYAALARIRTASAGDPVIAWDGHGRVFMGSESSGDPAGSKKTFGDVWVAVFDNPDGEGGATINDGKRFRGSQIIARGSSAPNLLGVFQDKTSIEADRTGGRCDANAYFAWASFRGNGVNSILLSRTTDHGESWSNPIKVTESVLGVQDPDIAITSNGDVYVVYQQFALAAAQQRGVAYVKSTDCGRTFSRPQLITNFTRWDMRDIFDPEPIPVPETDDPRYVAPDRQALVFVSRDCGDFSNHCLAGYTFPRIESSPRATADQFDVARQNVYIVYSASKPGTFASTGTTFGTAGLGIGSQSGVYFVRLNGANGQTTAPVLIDDQPSGQQFYMDISADGGVLYAIWWDSRNDAAYSTSRPPGNDAAKATGQALDVFMANSANQGTTWSAAAKVTDFKSNPNFEQFDNRSVPFAGDYLWVTSQGSFSFATWTDWRNTVAGPDPREIGDAQDNDNADVHQCRVFENGAWSGDRCPRDGGLDQDIYGAPGTPPGP